MTSITKEFEFLLEKLLYYLDRDPAVRKLNYRTIDSINDLEEYILKMKDDYK